ncbi:MauE/DoxX family redox-associated membrane protein [Sinosporangium siamense]|nr:MauE/DoxX family redox-associated membrane protein [Sinosporangium siamense]
MIAVSQLPVVALLLTVGALAKVVTVRRRAEPGGMSQLGPAALVPARWRSPVLVCCALVELVLAAGLIATAHVFFRWATIAFFAMSTYVLWELRRRRPDVGCGCFGDVSATPVERRSLARTTVLTAMSVGLLWLNEPGWWLFVNLSWFMVFSAVGGMALLAVCSPEIEETVARLRYRAPCERRPLPASSALARLRSSTAWRTHKEMLSSEEPTDSWRELCWRFFSYRGRTPTGEAVDVVFAVYLSGRKPPIKVAVVGMDGGEIVTATAPDTVPVTV